MVKNLGVCACRCHLGPPLTGAFKQTYSFMICLPFTTLWLHMFNVQLSEFVVALRVDGSEDMNGVPMFASFCRWVAHLANDAIMVRP